MIIQAFLDGTGLTDKKFAARLIKMNVSKEMAKYLRAEHMNFKEDKKIWNHIREASFKK